MKIAKVGRRGQITLPHSIRKRLKLKQGSSIAFVIKGGDVVLQPLTTSLRNLRGSVVVSEAQDFDHIRGTVKLSRAEELSAKYD